MTDRWYYRKAHTRRLSSGRTVSVRGGWAVRGADAGECRQLSFDIDAAEELFEVYPGG